MYNNIEDDFKKYVINMDFLKSHKSKYDLIIGNPPYHLS